MDIKPAKASIPYKGEVLKAPMSRLLMVDFIFYFLFLLYFIFIFIFILFSIFRTTWVRVYQSHCHISYKLMA